MRLLLGLGLLERELRSEDEEDEGGEARLRGVLGGLLGSQRRLVVVEKDLEMVPARLAHC